MSDNLLKAAYLGLLAVTVVCLTVLVGIGEDGPVSNGLLAVTGAVGGLSVWQQLTKKS